MPVRAPILACLVLTLLTPFGCSRTPTPTTPRAASGGLRADPAQILKTYDVEPYPGSTPVAGISAARLEIPEGAAHVTAWHTRDIPAKVIAFYARTLADPVVEKAEKQMVVGRNRAGNSVTVVAVPDVDRTRITITVR